MAGTKPSKVAARLSLADWLLVVLVGAVASVFSSTVATSTDAMVALVRARVPTEFEMSNLPVVALTADQWDPGNVTLSKVSRTSTIEENEMRTICSLTSGLSKKEMEAMSNADGFYRNAELQSS